MTPRYVISSTLLGLIAGATLAGTPTRSQGVSLYARLGGATKISAIVEQAVTRLAGSLERANPEHVKAALNARICALAGGGCRIDTNSIDMTDGGFLALVEELRGAMRAEHIPLAARNELLELLAPPPRDVASL